MDEVLKIAFVRPFQPIAWDEEAEAAKLVPPKDEAPAALTAH
jgi:hypothetical protein